MNVQLLLKVRERILNEPGSFIMRDYFCGSACCIGGWALMFSEKGSFSNPFTKACLVLDIPEFQGESLFILEKWPAPYFERYKAAESDEERAEIAAERIDHFISTKE